MTRERFLKAVEASSSVKELCERLDRTKPSVYTYAYKYSIPLKRRWAFSKLRYDGYKSYRDPDNHRRKVEAVLGRKLKSNECVHHIDGDKTNNENSNLLVCTLQYHQWLHAKMSLLWQQEHFGKVK